MKDFLKFTLATVTGIILSSIVLFIIGMVTLFGIVSTADTETIVKKNSVMMLDLNGVLVERTQESPLGILSQLFSDDSNTYGLDDILSSIKKAKENENIKGIYLQASMLGTSYASLQEIRNALLDFKESGKFIIAYGDSYTQGLYYLSSVADKVLLNPKGMIEWKGIASAPLFYKDLLQKIGVEMQIFKVGTYKSAVEPFISTEMSPANREQVTAFINSIWGQVTEGVSASRSLPVDSLNALADRMLMFYPAEESVQCGLADTLIYRNDVRNYLKQWVDLKEDDRLPVLGLSDMIASAPLFYKDLLQKIGVEMQIFKVGTYKSAVEPFISTEMSPANREQVTAFINSIWGQVTEGVSASRSLPVDSLNALADRMLMFYPAEESVQCGLADTLIYRNDVRNYLKQWVDLKEDDRLPVLGLSDMINVKKNMPKDKSGNIVAVYYASGEITDYSGSSTSEEGIVGTKVIRDLRKLKDDEDVKAVVLRVNSPGGSAFASEQIWHAVKELKTEKPVIVSMGDYAASGGYYISCVADTIVAEPTTLTGSIGIFGMVPNVKELSEKIGLTYDVVKTNKFSDFGNIMRPFNQDEKTLMQMMITQGYDTFVNRCAEGRHMSKEAIEKIAEGRVWTGEAAKELGLVDVLGGIDTALEIAVRKAGIEGYTVVSYPAKQDLLSSLLNTKPTNYVESQILKSKLGEYYQQFGMLKNLKERSMIQARIPFELNIK